MYTGLFVNKKVVYILFVIVFVFDESNGSTLIHNFKTGYYYLDSQIANVKKWNLTLEAWSV